MAVEGDVAAFLGIQFNCLPGGEIQMQQTGLIDQVLRTVGMHDSSPDKMPALQ